MNKNRPSSLSILRGFPAMDLPVMSFELPARLGDQLMSPIRQDLQETRSEIIKAIASLQAGRNIFTELTKPDLHAPIGPKEIIAHLHRGPDGLFFGHARGPSGKIVGQAKWLKVTDAGSRLFLSAGVLTGHLMLVEMSQKLDRLQGSVDKIREALDDDRMQTLRAAIGTTRDAVEARRNDNRQLLLTSTVPHLNGAVLKTIAALKREIAEVPSQPDWWIPVVGDPERKMREALAKAEQTLHACLEGISILGQAYIAIDEPALGYRTVLRALKELEQTKLADAEFRARLLRPASPSDRPELIWREILRYLPELQHAVEVERDRQQEDPVEIQMGLTQEQLALALEPSGVEPHQ